MKYYLSAGNTTPPRLPDEPVLSAPLNLSTKACVSPAPHTPGNIYYISTIISIISTSVSTTQTPPPRPPCSTSSGSPGWSRRGLVRG